MELQYNKALVFDPKTKPTSYLLWKFQKPLFCELLNKDTKHDKTLILICKIKWKSYSQRLGISRISLEQHVIFHWFDEVKIIVFENCVWTKQRRNQ